MIINQNIIQPIEGDSIWDLFNIINQDVLEYFNDIGDEEAYQVILRLYQEQDYLFMGSDETVFLMYDGKEAIHGDPDHVDIVIVCGLHRRGETWMSGVFTVRVKKEDLK